MLGYVAKLEAAGAPELPVFIGGQSMGGEISLLAALREPQHFAGLILASAAVDVERTLVMRQGPPERHTLHMAMHPPSPR